MRTDAASSRLRGWRRLLPSAKLGWWSLGLLGGALLFMAAFFALVASGERGGDTFFSNLWLSGTILPAAGLAMGAGAVGAVAIVRDTERSPGVFLTTMLGLLVLLWVLAELAFPH